MDRLRCLCKLCNDQWFAMYNRKPKACPKCKRYDWDQELDIITNKEQQQ